MKYVYPIVMYLEGNPSFKVIFTAPTTGIVVEVDQEFKDIYFVGQVKTTFNSIEQPNSQFNEALGSVEWYAKILRQQRQIFRDNVKAITDLLGE